MTIPKAGFPPAVQWINTVPVLFPLENIALWGLGLIMTLVALSGIIYAFQKIKDYPAIALHLLWILGIFFYQGLQFAKPMRYFYPVYPSLAIISGPVILFFLSRFKSIWIRAVFFLALVSWPLAFISIYSRPHSRALASGWINAHIPAGSTLSCEHWDDCLPLGGSGPYRIIQLPLYDPDSPAKYNEIVSSLSQVDYLILSSNRLYGSITRVPEKYPKTSLFYTDLFSGWLGFVKVAEFTSRPNLPVPGLRVCLTPPFINYGKIAFPSQTCPLSGVSFVDDYADESWTVYDHPKIIIFRKI